MARHNKRKSKKPTEHTFSILFAEDDLELRKLITWSLEKNGYRVVECADGTTLMRKLGLLGPEHSLQPYDLIISDNRMPGATGLQVLESARALPDFPPMILITAFPDAESREQAERLGAAAMLAKPLDMDDLLQEVREVAQLEPHKRYRPVVWFESGDTPRFPFEITFRHNCGSEPARDYILSVAKKLDSLSDHITNIRMIVDESDKDHRKKHRYTITLILITSGKSIVVKHNTDGDASSDNLYMGINVAIGAAFRRLTHYLKKRQGFQKHSIGSNEASALDDVEPENLPDAGSAYPEW